MPAAAQPRPRRLLLGLLGLVALAHLLVVVSIAGQPFAVEQQAPEERSIVWPLFNDTVHRTGPGADFFAVYHSGVAIQQRVTPYRRKENPQVTPYSFPFRYPLVVAETFGRFFTFFTPRAGYVVWVVLLEVLLAGLIAALWRRIEHRFWRAFCACALLLSTPYFLELHMGQFTFATVGLAGLGVLAFETKDATPGRKLAGGFSYAAAIMLKVFPLALLPAFLRERRTWLLVLGAGVAVVVMAISFSRVPQYWTAFYDWNFDEPHGGLDAGNYGLVYLLHLMGEVLGLRETSTKWSALAPSMRWFLLIPTALVVFAVRRDDRLIAASVLLLAHFLSYVHVWEHHVSGIVLLGVLMVASLSRGDGDRFERKCLWVAAACVVLLALPTLFAVFDSAKDPLAWHPDADWSHTKRIALALCKAGPTLGLFVVGLAVLLRSGLRSWRAPDS
jgi:hypothetical protein